MMTFIFHFVVLNYYYSFIFALAFGGIAAGVAATSVEETKQ